MSLKFSRILSLASAGAIATGLVACSEQTTSVNPITPFTMAVTVTNLQPADGLLLTPVFLTPQNGVYDMFDVGSPASENVERLIEDGTTQPRIDAAINSGGVSNEATATDGGPIAPGESRTVEFTVTSDNDLTQFLSYMSMVIPSNDAFIGNDDPQEIDLFDSDGNPIPRQGATAIVVTGDDVLDGGTEVNDEAESSTAALGQADPDTGTDEGGTISQHPGLIGSEREGSAEPGRVLTANPGGDFTATNAADIMSIEITFE
ncbi:MAG: spondin domain-containing protein [Cyanobacteria bacterium J06639_1]